MSVFLGTGGEPIMTEPDEPLVCLVTGGNKGIGVGNDSASCRADTRRFWRLGGGYSLQQSTRPQTVAYALVDSPVAQLTWILDKFYAWTDHHGSVEDAVNRDRILDTVTLYWLTTSGGSSARFYWENFPPKRNDAVTVPAG